MSVLFAVAIAVVPYRIASLDGGEGGSVFETSRERARTFIVRNPQLDVDTLGELVLDPTWLSEMRAAAGKAESAPRVELPERMLARSQARLDALISAAYEERIKSDPAWRLGVLDARSPTRNYFAHAFVHDNLAGLVLSALVLLLVGAALELTWGSMIFAAFTMAAIPMTAYGYRLLDASSGVPWSGGAGLAGALLGAYFIRGLGGHFWVPGWILLPAWLGVEAFVVRGFWIDDIGSVPWATFCAAVGMGALVAGALRLANIETKVESRASKRASRGPNPVVSRAARLRSDGDPYQAFDLIQAAWRDDPTSEEIAESFFAIAVEVGQPEAAAPAIVPSLRSALRKGDVARALEYWLPLATRGAEVEIEATVAVRLGEALLDAGHPTEAVFTLGTALNVGVSTAQAIRIVNVVRDLDDSVTRQAATIALGDASLDPKIRTDLEGLALTTGDDEPPEEQPTPVPTPIPESRSQLDRRVQAEHHSIDTTAFPIDSDADIAAADPNEASLAAQALDTGAFSAENLSAEPAPSGDAGDMLSHWNDGESVDGGDGLDLGSDFGGDLDEDLTDETLFDANALESEPASHGEVDFGLDLGEGDDTDAFGPETDRDRTPLIDATDELTSPLVNAASALRPMKALDAVPIAMTDELIEIDASPRGKSKLPYSRIQTIAMAAVKGLGPRPVLLVDLVLNGGESADGPMKLIRFRSDRFDPLAFASDAGNPLAALIAWVGRLQGHSNAICLPSQKILEGNFGRFESLEDYERDILAATRIDED